MLTLLYKEITTSCKELQKVSYIKFLLKKHSVRSQNIFHLITIMLHSYIQIRNNVYNEFIVIVVIERMFTI